MQSTAKDVSTHRTGRLSIARDLILWLAMVAATVIPLFLSVQASGLAVTTVAVAIVVGAALFAYLQADANLSAEVKRTATILDGTETSHPETNSRD